MIKVVMSCFRPSFFLFFFSLHVGVVTISAVGLALVTISSLVNLFSIDKDINRSNRVVPTVVIAAFNIFGYVTFSFGFLGAYTESGKVSLVAYILFIVHYVSWTVLTVISITNVAALKSYVCLEHRCPDRFFIRYCNDPSNITRKVFVVDHNEIRNDYENGIESEQDLLKVVPKTHKRGNKKEKDNYEIQVPPDNSHKFNVKIKENKKEELDSSESSLSKNATRIHHNSSLGKTNKSHQRPLLSDKYLQNSESKATLKLKDVVESDTNKTEIGRINGNYSQDEVIFHPGGLNESHVYSSEELRELVGINEITLVSPIGSVGCKSTRHTVFSIFCALLTALFFYGYGSLILRSYWLITRDEGRSEQ